MSNYVSIIMFLFSFLYLLIINNCEKKIKQRFYKIRSYHIQLCL